MTYRDDRSRLDDILKAIAKVEKYQGRGRDACAGDELIQSWLVSQVQTIGEAASKISEDLQSVHPEVPSRLIVRMRHILVHDYFETDFDEVWNVVVRDLPDLKTQDRTDSQSPERFLILEFGDISPHSKESRDHLFGSGAA